MKGMYCEVELRGQGRPGHLVVPRHAILPAGHVHVLDAEQRLRRRAVAVAWRQGEIAVIRDGLAAGDALVVSDIVPAVDGMRVNPTWDPALAARVVAAAEGALDGHD